MKKPKPEFPCVCGHEKKHHFRGWGITPYGSCLVVKGGKIHNISYASYTDDCGQFREDKLGYMERQYEKLNENK